MAKQIERREFGRRQNGSSGWIRIPGRPRLPCRVLNETSKGALLEFEVPSWLPFQFELLVESDKTVHTCEIRHSRPDRLGVYYIDFAGSQERGRKVTDGDEWMAHTPEKK